MKMLPLKNVFVAALIASLAAAIIVAVFHFMVTEPLIEQAIALEEQHQVPGAAHEEPVVSREGQRFGLFAGFLLYGITWGLLFGMVYVIAQPRLPGVSPAHRGMVLAG